MTMERVAAAVQRVATVLRRRPEMGRHDDAPAVAAWHGDTRTVVGHANGTQLPTDISTELGGTGDLVTPGWLFRAGVAACATTSIALAAAARGIELGALEVKVESRSDTRGLLGMADERGAPIPAGPSDMRLSVRIAARGVAPDRLRALVDDGCRCAPITSAVRAATPLAVHVDVAVDAR